MDSLLAIYPTARKVEEELKRRSRDGCVMGHRIVTFPQLIETLWRESDSPPRMIDAIGERIALNQALSTSGAGGFPRFANGSVGDNGGLAACIGGLIRQLKSAAVTPMDLRDAARPLAAADRRRVEMVAEAFAAYEDLLRDRGLADAHDRERIVLEGLHQAERSGRRPRPLEGVKQLLIAEIYDLSLLQFMIVASLIRLIGDADLTIQAASHKVDANGFANLTWNRFVGEESIADKVLPHFVHRGGREGQLGFVLEHMFTDSYPAAPPADGTVTIVGAPDRLREAEEVARAIRRMLEANGAESADGSVRFERIGVVARDLQPYANYLETVFRRYRIPLRIEGTRSLRASALGRIVMDLLKLPAEGYRRVAIVALCNSPCLALGIRGGDQRLLAEIGYIDAAAGNIADRFAIAKSAAEAEAAEAGNDAARQRALRQNQRLERAAGAFARLIALCAPLEQPATAAEHAARLDHLLEELSFDPAAGDDGNAAGAALRETFDAITRASIAIAPATLITPAAFAGLLEEAMTQKMLEADCGGGEVAAMPVLDARGLDFDCVFILGLNEGTFPRYHGDDPIISDDIRPALNRTLAGSLRQRFGAYAASAPGPLLRTRRHHNAEDWFLFFLALSMPERRAVLSYAAGDERGNPIARSPFIDEVTALCGGDDGSSTIVRRIGGEEFIPQASACFSRNEMINAAALAGLLDDPCTEAIAPRAERESILRRAQIENRRESYLALPTREETEDHRADADKAALADHYDGRVHVDVRLRQLLLYRKGAPQAWSSGRFNELAACGFKFFAGRVLMLREEDDPAYEQSALETGDDVHRILHALMRRAPDFSDRSAAMEAAQAVLDEWRRRKEPAAREAAFFRMDCAKIERIVEEFVDYEIARRIAGEGAPAAIKTEHPLRFTLPDARLLAEGERIDLEVEGYIDRLDLYRDAAGLVSRIRVIDYKTARNADNYSKLLREEHFARTDFQLALYVSGALAELKEKLAPEVAIEVGYVVLRSNDKEAVERFPPELFAFDPGQQRKVAASGLEPVAGRLIELASGAVAGRFEVDPRQCDEYCAYRRVCRYNKVFA